MDFNAYAEWFWHDINLHIIFISIVPDRNVWYTIANRMP